MYIYGYKQKRCLLGREKCQGEMKLPFTFDFCIVGFFYKKNILMYWVGQKVKVENWKMEKAKWTFWPTEHDYAIF